MDVSSLTSAYSDYYSTLADNASAKKLTNQLNSTDTSSASDEELMDVCKQFESYLLEQVFKGMEKTIMKDEDEEDSSTGSLVDYFKDQTIQEIASESTESNSLGLAQMLYNQLKINMGVDPSSLTETAEEEGKVDTDAE